MRRKQFWKSIIVTGVLAALVTGTVSCQQQFDLNSLPREIAFGVLDEGYGDTKTVSVVTTESINASGFRASATTGSSGSESSVWTDVSFSVNADGFFTAAGDGKWWPAGGDPNYHFYASNVSLTHTAAGATISASNETDVVCAYKETPVYKSVNSLNFSHVFGRLADVTVQAEEGYTVTNISVSITPRTGGTYNIRLGDGKTDATGWSSMTTGSATAIANSSVGTKSNDLYLVPGTYSLTLGWRATRGDYVKDYSGVKKDITIAKGKVNNVTATIGGQAEQVTFEVSLSAWTSQAHELMAEDFRDPPITFGGLMIAPAPLYYNGTTYVIKDDDWNHHSYNSVYGKNAGSYYHTFVDLGQYFDSRGNSFSESSGSIDNNGNKVTYDGYNDWRLPTKDEFRNLVQVSYPGPYRSGSVINGTYTCLYALIQLTGVSYINSTPVGLLLIPDGKTMTGMSRTFTWNTAKTTGNTGVTAAQLQEYLDKGCVFLPLCGWRSAYSWSSNEAMCWSATQENSSNAYRLYFYGSSIQYTGSTNKNTMVHSVRLVRSAN